MARAVEVLTELEAGGRARGLGAAWVRTGDYLIGRERVARDSAVLDPVAQRCDIGLGLDLDRLRLAQLLGQDRRQLRDELIGRLPRPPRERRLGRADDRPVLIDPNPARDVDNPEQLIEQVGCVDQRRMGRLGAVDPRPRRLDATRVERDADNLKPLRVELFSQFPPPGQIEPAPSPGGPGDHEHLRAAQ
jgi:hypothetical protein